MVCQMECFYLKKNPKPSVHDNQLISLALARFAATSCISYFESFPVASVAARSSQFLHFSSSLYKADRVWKTEFLVVVGFDGWILPPAAPGSNSLRLLFGTRVTLDAYQHPVGSCGALRC